MTTNIVLLAITVTTNEQPGFFTGPPIKPGEVTANAIAIWHPAKTVVSTNYHIGFWQGTNAVRIKVLTEY